VEGVEGGAGGVDVAAAGSARGAVGGEAGGGACSAEAPAPVPIGGADARGGAWRFEAAGCPFVAPDCPLAGAPSIC
jgi:hypothetical protein